MAEQALDTLSVPTPASLMRWAYAAACVAALVVMVVAITVGNDWFLNWMHVMTGCLWTGIDLFMGFIVGPLVRRLPLETRRVIITALVPRTLFVMPTLSIITTTAGWYLAKRMGYFDVNYPEFWWVIAALAVVTILTVQGMGYLLPTNVRIYFEYQKPVPDAAKIARVTRAYFRAVAFQGAMQVAIIVIMARFATGL